MTASVSSRIHCLLLMAFPFVVSATNSVTRGEEGVYRFVAQKVPNTLGRYLCVGLAGCIESLEEGTEVEGVEPSRDLADRLWSKLTDSKEKVVYRKHLRLRDGTKVSICSRAAIEELGLLIQERYEQTVNRLWQVGVKPDPNTTEGRVLLKTRQEYLDCFDNQVASKQELKNLINDDEDGLVALAGRGHRYFESGPPHKLIDKYNLKVDPKTGRYPAVPSRHAFLLTYDQDEDLFYVYDSDDPDRKWLVFVNGNEDRFVIDWQIDDHMGNGPSRQFYFNVRPLARLLADVRDIAEAGDRPTKLIEP